MKKFNLFDKILESSFSKNWNEAQYEWYFESVLDLRNTNQFESCLCGHTPIKKLCFIRNIKTGKEEIVGSCCVEKFDNDWNKIFEGIDKIITNIFLSVNKETLDFAKKKKYINDWEFMFYSDIMRKQKLSDKQEQIKVKINSKMIQKIVKKDEAMKCYYHHHYCQHPNQCYCYCDECKYYGKR